ncbi:CLIP-associating protein 2 [Aphelenchoides fujianensis]|nr:CLIP-associating protein 2 [Aphelenchoides fujianensis]
MSVISKREAGAVTRDDFEQAFENVPELNEQVTAKAMEKKLQAYLELNRDADRDYRLGNRILVEIRSLIKCDGTHAREILLPLSVQLGEALLTAIKDKRSAVMHEGCFTVAMVVKTFGHDVLNFALEALNVLVPYSQSSIRVMSSSANVASSYVCQDFMKHKARQIRGAVMELVRDISESWPVDVLKKNATKIRELVDMGIADAGPSAREASRDALTILSKKMPDVFQPPPLARSASRTRNFFDNRAATDMSSRMLSAKRPVANVPERAAAFRPKPAHGPAPPPMMSMRSRTPTATSTRANSQLVRANAAPPSAAQPRRQPTVDFNKHAPMTPPRAAAPTPKRSPAAPRPNVVPAQEAYAMAQMNRENIRDFNQHPELKTNGVQKSFDAADAVITKPAPVVQPAWKVTTAADLMGNQREQCLYLNAVLDAISLTDHKNVLPEAETALTELCGIIRAGAIAVWDTYFNPLFAKIVEVISANVDTKARVAALKCLKELTSYSRGISAKVSMLVNRLIDVQLANKDLALVKAVEECTTALAKNVPVDILLPVLKNIIRAPEQSQQKCAAAVKIISHCVLNLNEAETMKLVETIVPMVYQMYEKSSESAVRRDCVICLVVFTNKVKVDVLRPHISSTMEKLIDVYGKRPTMVNWR